MNLTEHLQHTFSLEQFPHLLAAVERDILIIIICVVLIIVAVFMDMWVGIDAARAAHEPIMSKGLRRTLTKALDYFRVVLFASLIDILGAFFTWYSMPYFAIMGTLATLVIEGKSVIENYRRKRSNAADVVEMAQKIIKALNDKEAKEIIKEIKAGADKNKT